MKYLDNVVLLRSAGGIVAARGVQEERLDPASSVAEARGVPKERIDAAGGVVATRRVALKRAYPQTGVALPHSNPRQRTRK